MNDFYEKRDGFLLELSSIWFNIINQLLVLGALKYLSSTTNNLVLEIMFWISVVIFLYNIEAQLFIKIKKVKNLIFYFFYLLVIHIFLISIYLSINSVIENYSELY